MTGPEPLKEALARPGLRVGVLSIFPEVIEAYCAQSIIGRAQREGVIEVSVHDLRAGADDPRRSVDDAPFGGGAGMVLAPEPLFNAVERTKPPRPIFLMSPSGARFDQHRARELAGSGAFSLLCGRYEGVDERVATHLVDGELSIGDYVLSGTPRPRNSAGRVYCGYSRSPSLKLSSSTEASLPSAPGTSRHTASTTTSAASSPPEST